MHTKSLLPLVVGNTVIVKPASDTPLGSIMMTQWLLEAGVPANAAQIITGSGSKLGSWLLESDDLNMLTLTGSTEVGVQSMCACSEKLHHCPPGAWRQRSVCDIR